MSISFALALYAVIWWVTLFAVLPLGLRTQEEEGHVTPGTPESAPAAPRLLRAVAINTAVAAVVFLVVAAAIILDFVPLHHVPAPRSG
jgi:predicted secreted protein